MAISEFAPGSEVIAAKKVWTSCGIRIFPHREWQKIPFTTCSVCRKFHVISVPAVCDCGAPLSPPNDMILPIDGFVASNKVSSTGDEMPNRLYASRVFFANYNEEKSLQFHEDQKYSLDTSIHIPTICRHSRFGWLFVINTGYKAGFRVCPDCGWAEPIRPASRPPSHHDNPLTNKRCVSTKELYTRSLGHRFMTDVLELRLTANHPLLQKPAAMLSLMYALLDGAGEELGIRRNDIDGTLYFHQYGEAPSLILFDTVPGGAGHVEKIRYHLVDAARTAQARLSRCQCGLNTSCYNCLRNYGNQYFHDILQRGYALEILGLMIGNQIK